MSSEFRGGVGNPSEFCKSENGWKRIQEIRIDTGTLFKMDIINERQKKEKKDKDDGLNAVSGQLSDYEAIIKLGEKLWLELASFNMKQYPANHICVSIPQKASQLAKGKGFMSEKQAARAIKILEDSQNIGFDFIST